MAQDRLTMTFLFCQPYDIIIWAGHSNARPSPFNKSMPRLFSYLFSNSRELEHEDNNIK